MNDNHGRPGEWTMGRAALVSSQLLIIIINIEAPKYHKGMNRLKYNTDCATTHSTMLTGHTHT